jgi:hypothetical protein
VRLRNVPGAAFDAGVSRNQFWRDSQTVRAHIDLQAKLRATAVGDYCEERFGYVQGMIRAPRRPAFARGPVLRAFHGRLPQVGDRFPHDLLRSRRRKHAGSDPGLSSARPYFGCDKRLGPRSRIVEEIADDCLRFPVHRRTVDQRSAVVEQRSEHISERSEADAPTSKVSQVPHPTTGSSSPVDGTARFSMACVTFDPSFCCAG